MIGTDDNLPEVMRPEEGRSGMNRTRYGGMPTAKLVPAMNRLVSESSIIQRPHCHYDNFDVLALEKVVG